MQDQNAKQGKWGETFNLFLNQAIAWRLKIVLKYTHTLHFILWNRNRLSIFSASFKTAFSILQVSKSWYSKLDYHRRKAFQEADDFTEDNSRCFQQIS